MASLEFAVPPNRSGGRGGGSTPRRCSPSAGAALGGRPWFDVGRFLGPNITEHYRRFPVAATVAAWEAAGLTDVGVRRMSLGGGLVMWGRRSADHARHRHRRRRERHRPAAAAGVLRRAVEADAGRPGPTGGCCSTRPTRCGTSPTSPSAPPSPPASTAAGWSPPSLAFFLAVGVCAHALDELHGRPLRTTHPGWLLVAAAVASLAGAVALGVVGLGRVGPGLAVFIVVGVALTVGYNLELFGGRLHNDVIFAAAWGAFPVLTAYYAQAETLRRPRAARGRRAAYWLSTAQRSLSTPARTLRRRVAARRRHRHLPRRPHRHRCRRPDAAGAARGTPSRRRRGGSPRWLSPSSCSGSP